MKKYIIAGFIILLSLTLAACSSEDAVLENSQTYNITSTIHSLDIQINAADFKIKTGDAFSVESNLKYLSVSENNGVLKIHDKAKANSNYSNSILTLYIPNNVVFDDVEITNGAAKLTVETLSANSLEFNLGAGDARFKNLNASSKAEIKGGAGQITIANGTINNLSLEMGIGELNLCVALLGSNDLEFGVGKSDLTLIGRKDDYTIKVEKGLGSISFNGKDLGDFGSSGNGPNRIEIEGGVGTVNIAFKEE